MEDPDIADAQEKFRLEAEAKQKTSEEDERKAKQEADEEADKKKVQEIAQAANEANA